MALLVIRLYPSVALIIIMAVYVPVIISSSLGWLQVTVLLVFNYGQN